MRRLLTCIFVALCACLGIVQTARADKALNSLQKEQKKLTEQIERTSQNVEDVRLSTKEALREVNKLSQDISMRDRVISKHNREIDSLNARSVYLEKEILRKELEYSSNKRRYVELIYHAYVKNTAYSKLIFIFSAETFYETYRRFRYIQDFASMRRQQAEQIEKDRKDLVSKRDELAHSRTQAQELLGEREREQKELIDEKARQDLIVSSLRSKEKELTAELERQQRNAELLSEKIQAAIEEQARLEQVRLEKRQKKSQQKSVQGTKSDGAGKMADNSEFASSKGKLPMPLSNATVTGRFGVHQHPVLKHVTTNNKGIYLTAAKGAVAQSVFKGEVTQRFSVPGCNNAVIVRHDNYLTVYSNLTTVFVKSGDKVEMGQKIGKVYEDSDDGGKATLFFQIWKERELQNPEHWLIMNR